MRKKIINLGLAGGGFYGFAQVAALKELSNYPELFDIKNIKGVSVGSMIAALYAVGYTPDELTDIIFNMDFDSLIRDSYFAYFRLFDSFGLYRAQLLEDEIERLIAQKTHIKLCTFNQIKKDLTIISTNLNYQCAAYFSRDHTPDMPISKAVRMSIGYPLIMTPVLYENDYYGDGGEFMNYPITTFENMDVTIGLTFAAHNENPDGTLHKRIEINDISSYIKALGSTMSRANYVSQIKPEHLKRSIVINIDHDISSMQFNLTIEQKKILYECGINAVRDQISKFIVKKN